MSIGFTFKDRNSKDFGIVLNGRKLPIAPLLRRNDIVIAGKNGRLRYGGETYDEKIILCDVSIIGENIGNLAELSREIGYWLSGSGPLIFDDEIDKVYDAIVYNSVDTEQFLRVKKATIRFEAHPFQKIRIPNQINVSSTKSPVNMNVKNIGTAETGGVIRMKNVGKTNVTNISISRIVKLD